MKQAFYRIIYDRRINLFLRNVNKWLSPIIPNSIKLPPSGIIKINTEFGILRLKTNQTNYITRLLFWNGYKNFEYTTIFESLIKKVSTFYDIGANIGYYSLLAAKLNPKIQVVSFEPARGPHFYLKENIKLNGFTNIIAEPLAIDGLEGEIEFFEIPNRKYSYLKYNLAGEGNVGSKTNVRDFTRHKVNAVTLDNYVKSHQGQSIDLVKMDTEGSEHIVLTNAGELLTKQKPIVICETLFNYNEMELEKIMNKLGYQFYNHISGKLHRVLTLQRSTDNGVRDCFFVHPEKFHLIEEYVSS
ncbi:MAG: FkbM family methyltransferase [Candidatus Cloacimonetes bacterium]|nr:FkbM family methyltransferase [Candidatus Cloacimonadota bacterium]